MVGQTSIEFVMTRKQHSVVVDSGSSGMIPMGSEVCLDEFL